MGADIGRLEDSEALKLIIDLLIGATATETDETVQ
jgi:hypothetical protein